MGTDAGPSQGALMLAMLLLSQVTGHAGEASGVGADSSARAAGGTLASSSSPLSSSSTTPTTSSWLPLLCTALAVLAAAVWLVRQVRQRQHAQAGLMGNLLFNYLHPGSCTLEWGPKDSVVGKISTITVRHFRGNGLPWQCTTDDPFQFRITGPTDIKASVQFDGNVRTVSFTTRQSGTYTISVLLRGRHVSGSPFAWDFRAAQIDVSKCSVQPTLVTAAEEVYTSVIVRACDRFQNFVPSADFCLSMVWAKQKGVKAGNPFSPVQTDSFTLEHEMGARIHFVLPSRGLYRGRIEYRPKTKADKAAVKFLPEELTVLILTAEEMAEAEQNTQKRHAWYEAKQLSDGADASKPVYCYVSSKQLWVKTPHVSARVLQFMSGLDLFAPRTFSMRVTPASRFYLHDSIPGDETLRFTLDDSSRDPVTLSSPKRDVLFATYSLFLTRRTGGSESFEQKRKFFYQQLIQHHGEVATVHKVVRVRRYANPIEMVKEAFSRLNSLRDGDWPKQWHLQFINELGSDLGGVSREFFTIVGRALFAPEVGLFVSLSGSNQGLVHPNPQLKNGFTLEHFRFAGRIIGKVLLECAAGRPQYIPARFTQSFLAQLIGLGMHYKFFATDDPEFYRNKCKFILSHSVADAAAELGDEMMFVEEGPDGKDVELKPGGASIRVTDENKRRYLSLLAEYRLQSKVAAELKHFLKGLHELVPDDMLAMFDEHELELLICGLKDYDPEDLRRTAVVEVHGRAIQDFWTIVSNFTAEERVKLLQFITGSATLPPGGFDELQPPIRIVPAQTHNALPTAHTCFNQLLLPYYEDYESMQRFMEMALSNEEGFGLV